MCRKVLQLWKAVPKWQHGFCVVQVYAWLEGNVGDRCRVYIGEADPGMSRHEMSASRRAELPVAKAALVETAEEL